MLKRLAETFQSGLNTAVAATRDGVNRALPGNPALRDYDVADQTGTGGAHGLWDIYDAVKKTGRTPCSVWIFDKVCANVENLLKFLKLVYSRKTPKTGQNIFILFFEQKKNRFLIFFGHFRL